MVFLTDVYIELQQGYYELDRTLYVKNINTSSKLTVRAYHGQEVHVVRYEPPHDKTNKMSVRPAKISLGIHPVWSESSLCAWRKIGFLATHWPYSEDSDQTGRVARLIWVFAGRTSHFICFVMRRLIFSCSFCNKYAVGEKLSIYFGSSCYYANPCFSSKFSR